MHNHPCQERTILPQELQGRSWKYDAVHCSSATAHWLFPPNLMVSWRFFEFWDQRGRFIYILWGSHKSKVLQLWRVDLGPCVFHRHRSTGTVGLVADLPAGGGECAHAGAQWSSHLAGSKMAISSGRTFPKNQFLWPSPASRFGLLESHHWEMPEES